MPILFGIVAANLSKKGVLSFVKIQWILFVSISFQGIFGYFFVITNRLTFDNRLDFIYESPNFFASLLVVAILLGINLLKTTTKQNKFFNQYPSLFKTTLTLLLAANLFSLIKTDSMGAWIGLIVSLFFYFLLKINFYAAKRLALFLLFFNLLFLFTIVNLELFLEIIQYSPSVPATSLDSRIAVYLSSKMILIDHILLGIGSNNFQISYLNYQPHFPPYPQWAIPHAHNMLLHLWIEGGLASVIAILFLNFKAFTSTKTKIASSSVAISLVILIYFLFHGMIDVPFWKNDLAVLFWFFLSHLTMTKQTIRD
ncbi:MAG: O-antigen ligase family protein [Patescibacteria group bacterium]|nr:O-antigen ligase family protein [Patescibacteria group bacterium]